MKHNSGQIRFRLLGLAGFGSFSKIYEALVEQNGDVSRFNGVSLEEQKVNTASYVKVKDFQRNLMVIKVPHSHEDTRKEVLVLSRSCHPHVIQLHGVLTNREANKEVMYGLVLEHLDGPDLYDLMKNVGSECEEKVSFYADCVFSALKHLGSLKVTHGDVNLYNIVVTQSGRMVKLIDFGCARIYENEWEHDQFRNGILFDLKCFASCLMELLTGKSLEISEDNLRWKNAMECHPELNKSEVIAWEKSCSLFRTKPNDPNLSPTASDFIQRLLRQKNDCSSSKGRPTKATSVVDDIYEPLCGHKFLKRLDTKL